MERTFALIGSLLAMLAVIIGAFGAHAFRARLGPDDLIIFETAVRYQMYHALALVAASLMPALGLPRNLLTLSCGFWLAGMLLFSGSLYLLVLTGIHWLGPVTPVGGVCFMVGWVLLIVAALKK